MPLHLLARRRAVARVQCGADPFVVGVPVVEGRAEGLGTPAVLIRKSERSHMRRLVSVITRDCAMAPIAWWKRRFHRR